jgi:hypothetical protein
VIVLDHNIPRDQAEKLRHDRVHFRQIGYDVGRPEWGDQQELLRYLHRVRQPTLFTRDQGFLRRRHAHKNGCIVVIISLPKETALLIRRFLRHPQFRTKARRLGKVVELTVSEITWWEVNRINRQSLIW